MLRNGFISVRVHHQRGIQGDQEKGVTRQAKDLRASTPVDNHARDFAVDDLLFVIEVQHVDGGHLGGRAARPC